MDDRLQRSSIDVLLIEQFPERFVTGNLIRAELNNVSTIGVGLMELKESFFFLSLNIRLPRKVRFLSKQNVHI